MSPVLTSRRYGIDSKYNDVAETRFVSVMKPWVRLLTNNMSHMRSEAAVDATVLLDVMGFRMITGFTGCSQFLTIQYYNSHTNVDTLENTTATAHINPSVSLLLLAR
jgi:hypothetical protein